MSNKRQASVWSSVPPRALLVRALPPRVLLVLALLAPGLAFTSCSSVDRVPEQERYVLDVGAFVESMVGSVRQQHEQVDPEAEQRYRERLSTAFFTLDLRSDGLFRAWHGIGDQEHAFAGRWKRDGDQLLMQELVRDGHRVNRTSKAMLDHDTITMSGQRGAVQVFYVLRKLDTVRGQRSQGPGQEHREKEHREKDPQPDRPGERED